MNLTRPPADRIDYASRFGRAATGHVCPGCGYGLNRVLPSTMLTCDNPICDEDPKFLVPEESP